MERTGTEQNGTRAFAHYYASKSRKELILSDSPGLMNAYEWIAVTGKRQAREIAKQRNATTWNF